MKLSIRELLTGEKRKKDFSYSIPVEYNDGGNESAGDIQVSGEVRDMGGYMEITVKAEMKYRTVCARCLEKLEKECEVEITRPVAVKLENAEEADDYVLVGDNSQIDIDDLIKEELFLALPYRSLCSEDCKGLCPKCGCNRNKVKCGCTEKEPDPRLAVLRNIKFGD